MIKGHATKRLPFVTLSTPSPDVLGVLPFSSRQRVPRLYVGPSNPLFPVGVGVLRSYSSESNCYEVSDVYSYPLTLNL